MDLDDFLHRHVPWPVVRLLHRASGRVRRLLRRLRYRSMPRGGWGRGWRLLVFRCSAWPDRPLHVLAPVDGATFDWELLRRHVRGEPWPRLARPPDGPTGVIDWAGHHLYLVLDGFQPQRIAMGDLVPGEFGGGVDVGLRLVDVRPAELAPAPDGRRRADGERPGA